MATNGLQAVRWLAREPHTEHKLRRKKNVYRRAGRKTWHTGMHSRTMDSANNAKNENVRILKKISILYW